MAKSEGVSSLKLRSKNYVSIVHCSRPCPLCFDLMALKAAEVQSKINVYQGIKNQTSNNQINHSQLISFLNC